MVTGRLPFMAKTPFEVMRAHLDQRVLQPVQELEPDCPQIFSENN